MTTGKTIALTRQIFVSKAMSLLFNMLSRFVTALLHVLGNLMDKGTWWATVHGAVKEPDTTLQLNNNITHWKTQWADVKTVAENQMNLIHFHLYCKRFSATSKGTVGAWFLQSLKTKQAKFPSRTKPTKDKPLEQDANFSRTGIMETKKEKIQVKKLGKESDINIVNSGKVIQSIQHGH